MNYANQNWLAAFLCFLISFSQYFFTYIANSKDSSAKCYQNNKERLQKKLLKGETSF